MRISMPFACFAINPSKLILAGVTAALLSGCSDSIERFSANYSNPSDSDPVYTASVPQVKRIVRPTYKKPKVIAYNDETIAQSPIASAPLARTQAPTYDYVRSYKKPYKQPVIQAPAIAYDEQPQIQAVQKPIYRAPAPKVATYKTPAYRTPTYSAEEVVADSTVTPVPTAPKPTFQYKTPNSAVVAQTSKPIAPVPRKIRSTVAHEQTADAVATPAKSTRAGGTYAVASGDTLYSLGRKFNVSPFAIATLNGMSKDKTLSLGQSIRIPAGASASVATAKIKPPVATDEAITDDSAQADASTIPTTAKRPAPLALPKEQATVADVPAIPSDAGSGLAMRWPVRGKVISDFGKKPSGLKNEGINIAVPEGTSIRAAESGVVAYAGNELKGYGNLILIRHAGGYVTAYAHAKSLNVKRGDTVKRGDVIAIAGQTGAVQSPQLHFEVRKGATALDPTKYLSSSTAMN